jgi:hypothetical protein
MCELRAREISCPIEDDGHIVVFAKSRKEARKMDSRECDCRYIDIEICRAPDFDNLSPGPVSIAEYLKRGWCYKCHQCEGWTEGEDNLL